MTQTPKDEEQLRNIDQLGYENYRYLLDSIYNAGGLHKDHYELKDKVDQYIVRLILADRAAQKEALLAELEAEGPKDQFIADPTDYNEEIAYDDGFNTANAKWRTLVKNKKENS